MQQTFTIAHPHWLLIAFCLTTTVAAAWWSTDRARRRALLVAPLAFALAGWLLLLGERGLIALAVLTTVSIGIMSAVVGRRQRMRIGGTAATLTAVLRACAWLGIVVVAIAPQWITRTIRWEKPLLVGLVDHSRSLSLNDSADPNAPSRAARANERIAARAADFARLADYYDLRLERFGAALGSVDRWEIVPEQPLTALSAALDHARELRATTGEPPTAVLVISDGAENAETERAVHAIVESYRDLRIALHAVGIGPAGTRPSIELSTLDLPARIGSRERLTVPVRVRIRGAPGQRVALAARFGDATPEQRTLALPNEPNAELRTEFTLRPPGLGVQRVHVTARLPTLTDAQPAVTSAIVDVRDESTDVLVIADQPRSELAFLVRTLRGDARFNIEQRYLFRARPDAADVPRWNEYDVVVWGAIEPAVLAVAELNSLADAVIGDGVGLLLMGGHDVFNRGYYERSNLVDVSPTRFRELPPLDDQRFAFEPTPIADRHPVLRGLVVGPEAVDWGDLPELPAQARLGNAKPLAEVLAKTPTDEPLLAVLEVGAGRSAAVGWDASWVWALASDEGLRTHRMFWRQLVGWLANRRPVAWVFAERDTYVASALRNAQQTIRITAGITNLPATAQPSTLRATLQVTQTASTTQPAGTQPEAARGRGRQRAQTAAVRLQRRGAEWLANLPEDFADGFPLTPGAYRIDLQIAPPDDDNADRPRAFREPLRATAGFAVTDVDLERVEPTANVALLREAAELTARDGGTYHDIEQLDEALATLLREDPRRRIERVEVIALAERYPWLLLAIIVAALAIDWALRRRGGLV